MFSLVELRDELQAAVFADLLGPAGGPGQHRDAPILLSPLGKPIIGLQNYCHS